MEAAWKKEYSLAELVAADQFKTYDELKLRLDYVLGNKGTPRLREDEDLEDESEGRGPVKDLTDDIRNELESLSTNPPYTKDVAANNRKIEELADDDDTLSYFAKLAE